MIATKATRILVIAAPSFFHLVAAICEILLNESLVKRHGPHSLAPRTTQDLKGEEALHKKSNSTDGSGWMFQILSTQ